MRPMIIIFIVVMGVMIDALFLLWLIKLQRSNPLPRPQHRPRRLSSFNEEEEEMVRQEEEWCMVTPQHPHPLQ
jgi:hypothetical protein